MTIDAQGDIDWSDLRIAIPGAALHSSGAIDGDFDEIGEALLELLIDDGAASKPWRWPLTFVAKPETCTESPNWQRFGFFAFWLLDVSWRVNTV